MLKRYKDISWFGWGYATLLISLTLYRLATTAADNDLWGYLAFGRLFWGQNDFPYEDVFAYVTTLHPWVYHEWLTGVIFYPLYQSLGGFGLQTFKYAAAFAILGLTYATARRRGASTQATILCLAMMIGGLRSGFSPVRAQVFTYVFYTLTLYLLETARIKGERRLLLALPLIFLPWANLHAGFVAGLGLISLYALGEFISRRPFWPYLAVLGLAAVVTLINPYGWRYLTYLQRALTMPRPMVTEWASIYQTLGMGVLGPDGLLYVFLLLVFSLMVLRHEPHQDKTSLLVLGVTFILGVKNIRHLLFFFLCFGAYLPRSLKPFEEDLRVRFPSGLPARWRVILGVLILGASLVLTVSAARLDPFRLQVPTEPQTNGEYLTFYPMEAVRYLKDRAVPGKVLVYFDWGEFVIWQLSPPYRVAIDGRFETVYPDAVCQKYFDFMEARPNWREFLQQFPPDFILLPSGMEIATLLKKDPGWQVIYTDAWCILFGRP